MTSKSFLLWFGFVLCLLSPAALAAGDWKVEISPVGLSNTEQKALTSIVLDDPSVAARTSGHRIRVLNSQFGEDDIDDGNKALSRQNDFSDFRLDVWDYTANQMLNIEGNLDDRSRIRIRPAVAM